MKWPLLFIFGLSLVSSCVDFDEPEAKDPSPILGCYGATQAPSFSLERAGIKIEGMTGHLPFSYQFRKVGMTLKVPLDAQLIDGQFKFKAGDDYIYRVFHTSDGPVIRIAFGPNGVIRDYAQLSRSPCET